MLEQREAQKNLIKEKFKGYSYIELIEAINKIKSPEIRATEREQNLVLVEVALNELLEEKRKKLTMSEVDKLLAYFDSENKKAKRFTEETRKSLLSSEQVLEKSKIATKDNLNYKRLILSENQDSLTDEEKKLVENEQMKAKIKNAENYSKRISEYESEIKKQFHL